LILWKAMTTTNILTRQSTSSSVVYPPSEHRT
jgi:hypothetical protein